MTLKVMNDNNINILSKEDANHYYTLSGYTHHFISSHYGAKFEVTLTGLTAKLNSGQGAIFGRHIINDGETEITCQLPINSNGYLVLNLDLTKPAGSELTFTVKSILNQEDLTNKGTSYDLPLYHYLTHASAAIIFEDQRLFFDRKMNTDRIADQAITAEKLDNSVFLKIYPIGAIYTSTVNTHPSTLFGGVWTTFATGRTVVALDATQTEFNTIEKTGGAKSHTLNVNEIPSHTHLIFNRNYHVAARTDTSLDIAGNHGSSMIESGAVGGGQAHNNLPPYITVYMWKRTA